MKTAGFVSAAIVGLLLSGAPVSARGAADSPSSSPECGLTALYTLLRLEGIRPAYAALTEARPATRTRSLSLADLENMARRQGLRTRAVRLSSGLDHLDRPAIIHLRRGSIGHFVVLRPVGHTGRLVQVFDGLEEPVTRDLAAIQSSDEWSGFALVPQRFLADLAPFVLGLGALLLLAAVVLREWVTRHRRVVRREPAFPHS